MSRKPCELYEHIIHNRVQGVELFEKRISILNVIIAEYESLDCVLYRYMQSTCPF
jgi:hypothetical protein